MAAPEGLPDSAGVNTPLLLGCDFSSAPSPRKQIVLALGSLKDGRVKLLNLERFSSLNDFARWLHSANTWVGGFDLPFGLPRELVRQLDWPQDWSGCMAHYAAMTRPDIRAVFSAFCNARPVGSKFVHRATDLLAKSSPSMKWVNPPVAYMLHAGVPILRATGAFFPAHQSHETPLSQDAKAQAWRVALEAYPGLLARELLGLRSYKADDRARQTPERLIARKDLIHGLEQGATRLDLRLKLTHAQRDALGDDASGDALDAVLCLMQTAWAHSQQLDGDQRYGLPIQVDPLEGWIITA